ncbi:hypothetical protein F0261_15515 [Alteromonas sp. 07-89-2]|nr:hypothetical protein [Alteromonas sp. 07-89-2]TAP19286.1 hypothetical protein KUL49_19600 [Alteromonas sp. KUL17]
MAPVTSESGTEFQHGFSRHTEWYDLNKIHAIAQEILWYKVLYEKSHPKVAFFILRGQKGVLAALFNQNRYFINTCNFNLVHNFYHSTVLTVFVSLDSS